MTKKTFNAKIFLKEVRNAHAERDKRLTGAVKITDTLAETFYDVRNLGKTLSNHFNEMGGSDTLDLLLRRFLLLCQRNKKEPPGHAWPSIAKELMQELFKNKKAFPQVKMKQLIALTVSQGDDLVSVFNDLEFSDLAETPWIFAVAARRPHNPKAFLRKIQINIKELSKNPKFANFSETPGIYRQASTYYVNDPQSFLHQVNTRIKALSETEPFKCFTKMPWIYKHAAVNYPAPGSAEKYLNKVIKTTNELKAKKEFKPLLETPYVFNVAAIKHPGKPTEFLRNIISTVERLKSDPAFSYFQEFPGVFLEAAVTEPSNPDQFLKEVQQNIEILKKDPDLTPLRTKPGLFKRAAVSYRENPKEFLLKVISGHEKPANYPSISF